MTVIYNEEREAYTYLSTGLVLILVAFIAILYTWCTTKNTFAYTQMGFTLLNGLLYVAWFVVYACPRTDVQFYPTVPPSQTPYTD